MVMTLFIIKNKEEIKQQKSSNFISLRILHKRYN